MKRCIIIVATLLVMYGAAINAMMSGVVTREIQVREGRVDLEQLHYAVEAKNYVNGGVTFTYDVAFTSTPCVTVSVEGLGLVPTATVALSPCISANSATQTTVQVNVVENGGTVSEALNDDCIVVIYALGG